MNSIRTPAEIVSGFAAIRCRLELCGKYVSIPMWDRPRDEKRWISLCAAIKALPNDYHDLVKYMRSEAEL
jgi:hypothetical protein